MGQSRKTQVIAMSTDRNIRLVARAKSYRVQKLEVVKYPNHRLGSMGWTDVQWIPRTHQREDINWELRTALSMFARRIRYPLKSLRHHGVWLQRHDERPLLVERQKGRQQWH